MNDQDKTREELTEEIVFLRARVSELEHVKKALEETESRFQALFENMDNAVAVYKAEQDGEDFVLIDFNKAAEKIEQISRSEVLGKSVLEVFPGIKESGLFGVFQRVWRTRRAESYPVSEHKDHRIQEWRENFVYRLPSGEVVTTYSDETERKRSEDTLRQSEEKYRLIFSKERDAIVVTHEETYEILDVNESCERLYGYSREDMLRMKALDLSAEPEKSIIALQQGLRPEGIVVPLRWHRKKDGAVFPVEISSTPFSWNGERVVCSLIRDITERKNAEDELREKEKLLQSILSTSPVGISLTENRKLKWANPAWEEMFGFEKKEYLEQDTSILYSSEAEYKRVGQELYPNLTLGDVTQTDVRFTRQNGSIFEAQIRMKALDPSDPAKGTIAAITDISERKQAEDLLQFEKERFEMLAQNAPFGMLMISEKGDFQYLNPRFKEIFGYDLSDVPNGREWFRRAYPDSTYRKEVIAAWIDDLQGHRRGETRPRVFTVTCKNGSQKIINFRPVKLGAGQDLVTCEDITERKEAERELLESEQRYRTLFEQSRDAVIITTRDGKVEAVNQAFLDLFGFTGEEAANMDILNIYIDPSDRMRFQEDIERHGSLKDYEVRRRKKDGTVIECLLTSTVQLDENGRIISYQGIIRDVTERRQLQKQLLQAQKMEAIGQLAGGIAHDFNNILTAIIGYSDVLTQQIPEDSPYHSKLMQINRAGARAADLTRQLLAFSRKQILDLRPLNLNEVVANFEKMLRPLIGENIEVTTLLDPSVGKVMGDAAQIEQILLNLVINSRDAMPKGGKLTVETANVSLDKSYARTHSEVRPGPYVMLAVSDTGQGIDPSVLPRVFDPFFTTKEKDKGTGLGLSTVYGIVKQHQGHVTAYSEPGLGTTFKVYLPLVQRASEEASSASAAMPQVIGTETILIVEDEEIVRQLTAEVLESLGYSVLQCRDPEEAKRVSAAHQGPMHLLLTDVVLPQMDGKSLFGFLSPLFPDMRVLYVSGYAENAIVHHGVLDAGVKFLQKPFTVESLAKKVREVLDEV